MYFTFCCFTYKTVFSGKSHFIMELIRGRDQIFTQPLERIVFCTAEETIHTKSEYFEELRQIYPEVEIYPGLPNLMTLGLTSENETNKCLILDDLMHQVMGSKDMMDLFTTFSHHHNISVIYSSQNIFHQEKHASTIKRQATELVCFENKIDIKYLRNLSSLFSLNTKFLHSCFEKLRQICAPGEPQYILIGKS